MVLRISTFVINVNIIIRIIKQKQSALDIVLFLIYSWELEETKASCQLLQIVNYEVYEHHEIESRDRLCPISVMEYYCNGTSVHHCSYTRYPNI